MFQLSLTTYGQSLISNTVSIDGIALLETYYSSISSLEDLSSLTVVFDDDAAGNSNNDTLNLRIRDLSSNSYQAKTILLYKLVSGAKKVVAGFSQNSSLVDKQESSSVNIFLSFESSCFTNGFSLASIQASHAAAAINYDGLAHIENPNVTSDDEYSVYSKQQVDSLLQDSALTAGEGISLANNEIKTTGIPFGIVDNTSTATNFTVTVPGIYKLEDGVCCMVKNGVVTSASGFTLNVNGLGGKPCYTNMAAATRDTTIFNISYTMLFVYDSTRVEGGCWICYRGYDANTNTIGYQLRTNSTLLPVSDTARYYKLYFTSADGTKWVPASVNSTNNATTARAVNQRPINPFGRIVYTSANTNYTTGTNLAAATIWDQYVITLGYSFNVSGGTLALTINTPVYLKCAPQTDGSAIIDATTPIVQVLPSSSDGKIYIFLGVATEATKIELFINHPVYFHDGSGIKIWTGSNTDTSNFVTLNTAQTISGTKTFTSSSVVFSPTTELLFDHPDSNSGVYSAISSATHNAMNCGGDITGVVPDLKITIGSDSEYGSGAYIFPRLVIGYSDEDDLAYFDRYGLHINRVYSDDCYIDDIHGRLHGAATRLLDADYSQEDAITFSSQYNSSLSKYEWKSNTGVIAQSFKVPSGSSSQFLKADGSLDSNTYITSASLPTVNNASLTINKGGTNDTTSKTFTANASTDVTINLGLGAAADKAVDTSIGSSSSTNLPTTNAVKSYITGLNYITSSDIPITSISVNGVTQTVTNHNVDLTIDDNCVQAADFICSMTRTNVSGSGNLTISGTVGPFPVSGTPMPAGTYLVRTRMQSTTASYTLTVSFGGSYTLTSSNGVIDDIRTITLSSASTYSASITQVNAGTFIKVTMYEPGVAVETVGAAAVSNDYNDLDNIPTVGAGNLYIQKNGSTVATFSANNVSNVTANITVPTTVASLSDSANYVTTNTAQSITGEKTFSNLDFAYGSGADSKFKLYTETVTDSYTSVLGNTVTLSGKSLVLYNDYTDDTVYTASTTASQPLLPIEYGCYIHDPVYGMPGSVSPGSLTLKGKYLYTYGLEEQEEPRNFYAALTNITPTVVSSASFQLVVPENSNPQHEDIEDGDSIIPKPVVSMSVGRSSDTVDNETINYVYVNLTGAGDDLFNQGASNTIYGFRAERISCDSICDTSNTYTYNLPAASGTLALTSQIAGALTASNGIAIDSNDNIRSIGIPFGIVDGTSTSTAFTATVPGIDRLEDGVCVLLKNGVVTSASGFTININNLGAKPVYSNMAAATAETTLFNINYTMLFVYDSTRVTGGCWILYRGYYISADGNSVGYQLRTNSMTMQVSSYCSRYRLLFTGSSNYDFVPANSGSSTSATTSKTVTQTPINPFGRIVYYGSTTAISTAATPSATTLWDQCLVTLGYSFTPITLTVNYPVYLKCTPQINSCSVIIDSTTPIVQILPSGWDGKIYVLLGFATSSTQFELLINHPVYYHTGSGIRLWTGNSAESSGDDSTILTVTATSISPSSIGNDFRQQNSNSSSPIYYGQTVSIGVSQSIDEFDPPARISIFVPDDTYIGSIGFYNGTAYDVYPIYFRGDEKFHCAAVPAGSILRMTYYNDAFYVDFYDLADFGAEHEPIVRVGKLPHTNNTSNYQGTLVGLKPDGTFDTLLRIYVDTECAGYWLSFNEYLLSMAENSPIYVSFQGECFSAHPRVPFGFVTNLEYIYDYYNEISYDTIKFVYLENGSKVTSSATLNSYVVTNPKNGDRYFHVNNAPVYILYDNPSASTYHYISIGGIPEGCSGTLIGFLPASSDDAGLLRLVNTKISSCSNKAEKVKIYSSSTNSNYPLVFTSSTGSSTGSDRTLYTDTANDIKYNPSSNTLTCTTFSGSLSGTATNATNLQYSSTNVLSATSTSQVTAYGNIVPSGTRDLGTTSSHWDDLFCNYIGNSSNYVTYAYITNMYGTASKATADASGNTITTSYGSSLRTYTRATTSTYSTFVGSTDNKYIALYSNSGSSLGRVYLSDIIANAVGGYGGVGWGTATASSSSAGYLTTSSFGSVGSIGLFYLPGSGAGAPGNTISGTSLFPACLYWHTLNSTFKTSPNDGYDMAYHSNNDGKFYISPNALNSNTAEAAPIWLSIGSKMSGTWRTLSYTKNINNTYANLVLAVRIY